MIDRRKFIFGVLSLFAGPAIVRAANIMPVKTVLWTPPPLYFGELNLAAGRDIAYWLGQGADLTPPVYGQMKALPTIFSSASPTRH